MSDIGEPEHWDEQEVEVEDLNAPEKGVALYLYSLGEKWHNTHFRFKPLAYLCVVCMLLSLLLSGSAFLDASTPASTISTSTQVQDITCTGVTTNPQHLNLSPPPSLQTFSGDVNINSCSGDGHVIIIRVSPDPSNGTPHPWRKVTHP